LELVDDIVVNRVIKRRLDRYTVNEFEKATRRHYGDFFEMRDRRRAEFLVRQTAVQKGTESTGWERVDAKDCASVLDGLRTKIRESGLSPNEEIGILHRIYGERPTSNGTLIINIYNRVNSEERSGARRAERTEHQAEILELLDAEIEKQGFLAELQAALDEKELAQHIRVLPQPEILDHVQRYRTANAREFTQLLADYERIRRMQRDA
jgi:hypothetical protein